MNMAIAKLALLGGSPIINRPLAGFKSMGEDEVAAASEVIRVWCALRLYRRVRPWIHGWSEGKTV